MAYCTMAGLNLILKKPVCLLTTSLSDTLKCAQELDRMETVCQPKGQRAKIRHWGKRGQARSGEGSGDVSEDRQLLGEMKRQPWHAN